jgi:hypothetical protein
MECSEQAIPYLKDIVIFVYKGQATGYNKKHDHFVYCTELGEQ